MGYIIHSTENPNGRKPWNAVLQPGGLGAYFPNAEGIGSPSVMIDRDAANPCGWKGEAWAGAPVPRGYYPPDARLQYITARGQGLGRLGTVPTIPIHASVNFDPGFNRVGSIPVGPFRLANTTPQNPSTSNVSTMPTAPTAATPVVQPAATIIQATTPSGATVTQSTAPAVSSGLATAAQVAGTPVPVGTSLGMIYTDSAGNQWEWNGTSWVIATAASTTGSISSWLSQSNGVFTSLPNYVVFGGAALAAWFLLKKK